MAFLLGTPGSGKTKFKTPGPKGNTTPPPWAQSKAGAAKYAEQNTVSTTYPSGRVVPGPAASQVYGPPAPSHAVQKAEAKQRQLVNTYVTKAYSPKPEKGGALGISIPQIDTNIAKGNAELSKERNRLLNHPAVQSANAEGKVVPVKGLQKIDQTAQQYKAIEGPSGVAHSKAFGLMPRSLRVGAQGEKQLATRTGFEGKVARTAAGASALHTEKTAPSTAEDLAIASIGIPGIGVGGDIAKLAEAGATTIPKLFAEGGARQLAKDVGVSAAAKGAAVKGAVSGLAHAPSDALDAVRAIPEALRGTSAADLKAAAREVPGVAGKAVGRTVARSAQRTAQSGAHSISGIGAIAATQQAGIHTAPGEAASAFLKGSGNALLHHPGETLATTARSLPGLVTAPADVGIAAGQSVAEGSTKPLTSTVGTLAKGTAGMFSHLASGNPKEVEEAVRHETGLSPFIAVEGGLAKLHGSDLYTAPRGALRGAVESRRAAARAKAGTESGMRYANGKRVKQPLPVAARPGENYIFRGIGSKLESGKARRAVSLDVTRAGKYGETHAQIETNRLLSAAHGKTGASRLAKKMGREYEGAMTPMAKMGIPHTAEGHALMQKLADYYGKPEAPPVPNSLTDRMAANAAVEHPELFTDAKHAALTKEFKAQSERLSGLSSHASERARYIAQNDFTNHLRAKEGLPPVLKPEERVPKAVEKALGPKPDGTHWTRTEAWARYKELNAKAEQLRKGGKFAERKGVVAEKKAIYAQLKQFTNPEHVLDRSKLPGWNKQMVRDFAQEQKAAAAKYGLEKPAAYVADKAPLGPNAKGTTVERPFSTRAIHIKTGELARSGEASAKFEDVLNHSVVSPRVRMAYNELVHNTLNEGKVPVKVGNETKHVLTEAELKTAQDTHNWPANTTAVPIGVIKQALTGEHALTHEGVSSLVTALQHGGQDGAVKALETLPTDLKDEVLSRIGDKGTKYAAINSTKLDELVKQFQRPNHPNWRKAANVPTRLILNDPAWVFAQVFAKGIPIASALGPGALLHAPRAIRAMAQIQKMDPESQARIMAMVGSSAGVLGTPHGAFLHVDPYSKVRAIQHSVVGKKVWDLANGNLMGRWDRWNAAKMREFAAAVRADKGFRNFYGGFKGLNQGMRQIAEATKGMNAAQRLDYISRHPEMARSMQRNLDQIGGNWNSFTAMERKVAPFAIFYPWTRYSLDWTFHTFPVNHPVAATALVFLAQQNANELQKIASEAPGAKGITPQTPLANPLEYSFPVTQSGSKSSVFPVGTRISPGLGVVGSTITSGKTSNILQGFNLIIGTGVSLAANRDLFTGQDLKGGLLSNAANQLLTLSPGIRALEGATGFRGFGKGPQSAISKAYEQTNPGKVSRSVLWPYTPQSSRNFALQNALSKAEETIGNTSKAKQEEVQGDESLTVQARQAKVTKMAAEEKAALAQREKILKTISPALAKQSNAEYERYKESGGSSGGGGGFSLGSAAKGFTIDSSGAGFSLGGSKSQSKYKPPSEGIHLPGLPNISLPGGAIPNLLSSLIGGTKAQAAVPKGSVHATKKLARQFPELGAAKAKALANAEKQTGTPAPLLAGISSQESDYGRSTLPGVNSGQNSAGAAGPFQIGNGTGAAGNSWAKVSQELWGKNAGKHSIYNFEDAAKGAAQYLKDAGATQNPATWGPAALAYNHSSSYANAVVSNAAQHQSPLWRRASGGKAAQEGSTPYANPLPGWTPGRSDQGYDASPTKPNQPILAVSKGKVIATGAPGWPGGGGVTYKILQGPQKGKEVYAFENLNAVVKAGQMVKRGQVVAQGQLGGSIETGYYTGNPTVGGHPLNNQVLGSGQTYSVASTDGQQTLGSREFEKQILGQSVSVPASGGKAGFYVTAPTVTAYAQATGSTPKAVAIELKTRKLAPQTLLQKLREVERITSGNLSRFGIPSIGKSTPTPGIPNIAALGDSLTTQRRALARL